MTEGVRPLHVDVAARLRLLLAGLPIDSDVVWTLTRLCEEAQAQGYHAGYMRGCVDGHDAERRERDLLAWLHAEAVWNWQQLAHRYDRTLAQLKAATQTDRYVDVHHLVEAGIAIARLTKDSDGRPVEHDVTQVALAVAHAFDMDLTEDAQGAPSDRQVPPSLGDAPHAHLTPCANPACQCVVVADFPAPLVDLSAAEFRQFHTDVLSARGETGTEATDVSR